MTTKINYNQIKGATLNALDFGVATSNTGAQNTAAMALAEAAITSGSTLYIPAGNYIFNPCSFTKPFRILGESTRQQSTGTRLGAAGSQTHIFSWKGGDGTFLGGMISGLGFDYITLYGGNYWLTDAALVLWNCNQLNSIGLNISNVWGSAMRLKNAQDMHFVNIQLSDVGDNGVAASHSTAPVIYCDPTGDNNVNNIYFTDPHFESVGWSILTSSNTADDQIEMMGGKVEARTTYAGQTATNLAFNLFNITGCNRFILNSLTFTNVHIYSLPTITIGSVFAPTVTGCKVFNVADTAPAFINLFGTCSAYTVRDNGGYFTGGLAISATEAGYSEKPWRAPNSSYTNQRVNLEATSQPPSLLGSNPGGSIAYGLSNSLTGVSYSWNLISDQRGGVKVPQGYPRPITVTFRVYSDLATKTFSIYARDSAHASTLLQASVAVTTAFVNVSIVISAAQLATAVEITLSKDQGDNNLYIDGAWIRYSASASASPSGLAPYSTMTWAVGDKFDTTTPVVGQPTGWYCTVAGTPGTWVALANL